MQKRIIEGAGWLVCAVLVLLIGFIVGSHLLSVSFNFKNFKLPSLLGGQYLEQWRQSKLVNEKKKLQCLGCNVVVLDIDILRADFFDCERRREITPFLCSLADKSIYFENHYSHSDLTKPSIESFLSSTYPISHGVWDTKYRRKETRNFTLQNVLKGEGYHSYINAFRNPQVPAEDFDEKMSDKEIASILANVEDRPYFYYFYSALLHLPYLSYFEESRFLSQISPHYSSMQSFEELVKDLLVADLDEYFTPQAYEDYPEIFARKSKDEIFKFLVQCRGDMSMVDKYLKSSWILDVDAFFKYVDITNAEHMALVSAEYRQRLAETDKYLSHYLASSNALNDKTIIVFRSDHGDEFMEHGKISHANKMYQELIKVPFFIYVPGLEKQIRYQGLSQTVDEAPTLLDVLGVAIPKNYLGFSLLEATLTGQQPRSFAIGQKGDVEFRTNYYLKDAKKLIMAKDYEEKTLFELYDLAADPNEKNNLAKLKTSEVADYFSEYQAIENSLQKYSAELIFDLSAERRQRMFEEGYF